MNLKEEMLEIANGRFVRTDVRAARFRASQVLAELHAGNSIQPDDLVALEAEWRIRLVGSIRAASRAKSALRWLLVTLGGMAGGAYVMWHSDDRYAMLILCIAGVVTLFYAFWQMRSAATEVTNVRDIGDILHLLGVAPAPTVGWALIENSPLEFEIEPPKSHSRLRLGTTPGNVMLKVDRTPSFRRW